MAYPRDPKEVVDSIAPACKELKANFLHKHRSLHEAWRRKHLNALCKGMEELKEEFG